MYETKQKDCADVQVESDSVLDEVNKKTDELELQVTTGQGNEARDMEYVACLKTASEMMADCAARLGEAHQALLLKEDKEQKNEDIVFRTRP